MRLHRRRSIRQDESHADARGGGRRWSDGNVICSMGGGEWWSGVKGALATLEPRDGKVLRLYFGLEGEREHTLEEIGNMLGVTRERIRQLRDRALRRLREGGKGGALESFAA